jgi:hypothetical protein
MEIKISNAVGEQWQQMSKCSSHIFIVESDGQVDGVVVREEALPEEVEHFPVQVPEWEQIQRNIDDFAYSIRICLKAVMFSGIGTSANGTWTPLIFQSETLNCPLFFGCDNPSLLETSFALILK